MTRTLHFGGDDWDEFDFLLVLALFILFRLMLA